MTEARRSTWGYRGSPLEGYPKVPVTGEIWVDSSRTDRYTPNGQREMPYKDLVDAVLNAQEGNAVNLAPGTYTITQTLTPQYGGVLIRGVGDGQVDIASSTVDVVTCPTAMELYLDNLTITATGSGKAAVKMDTIVGGGLFMKDVELDGPDDGYSLYAKDSATLRGSKVKTIGGEMYLENVSDFRFDEIDLLNDSGALDTLSILDCDTDELRFVDGKILATSVGVNQAAQVENSLARFDSLLIQSSAGNALDIDDGGGASTVDVNDCELLADDPAKQPVNLEAGSTLNVGYVEWDESQCTLTGTVVKLINASLISIQATKIQYVDNSRTDVYTPDGTVLKPYKTIAAAIAASATGDRLHIQPGTYTEALTVGVSVWIEAPGVTITHATLDVITISDGFDVVIRGAIITAQAALKSAVLYDTCPAGTLRLVDCVMTGIATGFSIHANGSASPVLQDCTCVGPAWIEDCTNLRINQSDFDSEVEAEPALTLTNLAIDGRIIDGLINGSDAAGAGNKALVVTDSLVTIIGTLINSIKEDALDIDGSSVVNLLGGVKAASAGIMKYGITLEVGSTLRLCGVDLGAIALSLALLGPVEYAGQYSNGIQHGRETITGVASTATVTFPVPYLDTNYTVKLTPAEGSVGFANVNCWASAFAIGAFQINISMAPGGADTVVVHWEVIHD